MSAEKSLMLVGCQKDAQSILQASLKRAGFSVRTVNYSEQIKLHEIPSALLVYLRAEDIEKAGRFLRQQTLSKPKRILIIDSHDKMSRRFVAEIDVDDVMFQPIRIKELLSRLELIFERDEQEDEDTSVLTDEFEFAQKIQELSKSSYSGAFHLDNHVNSAEVFFAKGKIVGIHVGNKIQAVAASAFWRCFPTSYRLSAMPIPAWGKRDVLSMTATEFTSQVVQAGEYFVENFQDINGVQTVFKLNSVAYEGAYRKLPKQVRHIVQMFDGFLPLSDILNTLNVDDILLLQIVRRLLDEHLIVECEPESGEDNITLESWMQRKEHQPVQEETSDIHSCISEITPSLSSFVSIPFTEKNEEEGEEKSPLDNPNLSEKPSPEPEKKKPVLPKLPQIPKKEKDESSITQKCSSPFFAVQAERKTFTRAEVEHHLSKAHEPLATATFVLKKGVEYSDELLEQERLRDEAEEARQQAEDEAALRIAIDASQLEEDGDEDSDTSNENSVVDDGDVSKDEFGDEVTSKKSLISIAAQDGVQSKEQKVDETDAETEKTQVCSGHSASEDEDEFDETEWFEDDGADGEDAADTQKLLVPPEFSAEKEYKRLHSGEYTSDQWKKLTLARLKKEEFKKFSVLIYVLVGLIVIFIILSIATGTDDSKGSIDGDGEKVAVNKTEKAPVPEQNAEPEQNDLEAEAVIEANDEPAAMEEETAGAVGVMAAGEEADTTAEVADAGLAADVGQDDMAVPVEESALQEQNPVPEDAAEPVDVVAAGQMPVPDAVQEPVAAVDTVPETVPVPEVEKPVDAQRAASNVQRKTGSSERVRSHRERKSKTADDTAQKTTGVTQKTVVPASKTSASSESSKKAAVQARLQAVRTAINKNDLNTAKALLEPLLEERPNDSSVVTVAIQLATKQGDNASALAYSKRIQFVNENKPAYWKQRAKLHKALGQMKEADACLETAAELVGRETDEGKQLLRQKVFLD